MQPALVAAAQGMREQQRPLLPADGWAAVASLVSPKEEL